MFKDTLRNVNSSTDKHFTQYQWYQIGFFALVLTGTKEIDVSSYIMFSFMCIHSLFTFFFLLIPFLLFIAWLFLLLFLFIWFRKLVFFVIFFFKGYYILCILYIICFLHLINLVHYFVYNLFVYLLSSNALGSFSFNI